MRVIDWINETFDQVVVADGFAGAPRTTDRPDADPFNKQADILRTRSVERLLLTPWT